MAITSPVYCCREDVQLALDVHSTFRSGAQIDRAVMSAATDIWGMMHRRFYPVDAVRSFDWPNDQRALPWRLWFEQYDLVQATQVTSGGQVIPIDEIFFEPANKEPDEPYTYLELNRGTDAAFGVGETPQHDILITGTWGYSAVTTPAGALASAVADATSTSVLCTDSSVTGVGSILLAGTERMLVTDRAMAATGQTLTGDLAQQNNAVSLGVQDGTQIRPYEVLLVGSERMLVTDVAGDTVTVKRGWDGSVLAAHSESDAVYAGRQLTVTRGALGTTAAAHSSSDVLARYVFPGLITELSVALALNGVLQEQSGYSRTVGEGDNLRNASGAAIADLKARAIAAYGRKARMAVI